MRHSQYGWVILITATLVVFGALGLARFGYTLVSPMLPNRSPRRFG